MAGYQLSVRCGSEAPKKDLHIIAALPCLFHSLYKHRTDSLEQNTMRDTFSDEVEVYHLWVRGVKLPVGTKKVKTYHLLVRRHGLNQRQTLA